MFNELTDLSIPAGKTPTESLIVVEQLVDRLNENGSTIDVPFLLSHLLSALRPEYNHDHFTLQSALTLERGGNHPRCEFAARLP